jgi:hypothetical protein
MSLPGIDDRPRRAMPVLEVREEVAVEVVTIIVRPKRMVKRELTRRAGVVKLIHLRDWGM